MVAGSLSPIDVSIVLNAHREAAFLPRVLDSLDEAARYARTFGITCELVVVEDRPDAATRAIFLRRDYSPYVSHEIIEVDNGSLGLSRNAGLAASHGRMVTVSDADDLISFNYIVENVNAVERSETKALFFPQYLLWFGAEAYIYELQSMDITTPQALASYHPFVSRFFTRRDWIADFSFVDLRLTRGFAYEDWHFNLQVVAAGFDMRAVPDTILFYRRNPGSLCKLADGMSNRQTAYAPFFDPATYLRLCAPWREAAQAEAPREVVEAHFIRERFIANPVCRELTKAAAHIDPAVNAAALPSIHAFANVETRRLWGVAYEDICRAIAGQTFDHILLVPSLDPAGGARHALHVLRALVEQDSKTRILVLAGEACDAHAWLERLPANALFLDVFASARDLTEYQRQVLTLRTIQACGRKARIHVKPCRYAVEFIRTFGNVLDENDLILYRCGDEYELFFGARVRNGYVFDFISDFGDRFCRIIADNDRLRHEDLRRLPHLEGLYVTLYDHAEAQGAGFDGAGAIRRRILWASPIDDGKDPEMLPRFAAELAKRAPDVAIDVYSRMAVGRSDLARRAGSPNVTYCGVSDVADALGARRHDVLVYSAACEGLPGVVLDAMAAGLVVVAQDIGGVGDALRPEAGLLLEAALSGEELARAFADAIARCYADPDCISRLRAGALNAIAARHGKAHFNAQVESLFRCGGGSLHHERAFGALLPS